MRASYFEALLVQKSGYEIVQAHPQIRKIVESSNYAKV